MRRSLAILLVALLALAPALSATGASCACVTSPAGAAELDGAGDGCCAPKHESEPPEPDDPADDRPCDGQDCSLLCCGAMKNVTTPHRATSLSTEESLIQILMPGHDLRGSSHLRRLKRPPRPTPSA